MDVGLGTICPSVQDSQFELVFEWDSGLRHQDAPSGARRYAATLSPRRWKRSLSPPGSPCHMVSMKRSTPFGTHCRPMMSADSRWTAMRHGDWNAFTADHSSM